MSRALHEAADPGGVGGDGLVGDFLVEVRLPLLGQDGPRTYFVAFTTPAEARGAGGYMATWAELREMAKAATIRDGDEVVGTGVHVPPNTLSWQNDF